MQDSIVMAPHPDDAALACGGTIAKKIRENRIVHIVYATNGRNSHLHTFGIDSNPSPQELVNIRKEEAREATKVLGVKEDNLTFLNFVDGSLDRAKKELRERVVNLLEEEHPSEVYYPYKRDFHQDHRVMNEIVETSVEALPHAPRLYQYPIWPPFFHEKDNDGKSVKVDVSNVVQLKRRAIKAYESQVTLFSQEQTRPVLSEDHLEAFQKKYERFLPLDV